MMKNDPVGKRLHAIAFRQRLFNVLALMLGSVCAVLGYLLAAMSADRLWELSQFSRHILLFSAMAAGAAGLATGAVLALFRRRNPLVFARAVDRALGCDDDVLVTCVELNSRHELGAPEQEIAGVLREQALARLQAVDADQIVSTRLLAVFGYAFLGLAGALFCAFLLWGSSFGSTLARCLMPWREIAPPRAVHIVGVQPGNGVAATGEPVKFAVQARGELPAVALLRYRLDGESAPREVKLPSAGGRYEKTLPGFSRAVIYWVQCGDAAGGPFHLAVADRPLVASVQLKILPPPYAPFAPAREIPGGHAQAIAGSRIEISAMLSRPASSDPGLAPGQAAWMTRFGAGRSERIPMVAAGRTLKTAFTLDKSFEYQLGFIDTLGLASRESVQYRLKAVLDAPPRAALFHEGESRVAANAVVTLRATASDDLGVARMTLRVRREAAGRLERPFEIDCSPPGARASAESELRLDLSRLKPAPGDVLACTVVAEDCFPTPQQGESPPVRLVIAPADPEPNKTQPGGKDDSNLERLVVKRRGPDAGAQLKEIKAGDARLSASHDDMAGDMAGDKAQKNLADDGAGKKDRNGEYVAMADMQEPGEEPSKAIQTTSDSRKDAPGDQQRGKQETPPQTPQDASNGPPQPSQKDREGKSSQSGAKKQGQNGQGSNPQGQGQEQAQGQKKDAGQKGADSSKAEKTGGMRSSNASCKSPPGGGTANKASNADKPGGSNGSGGESSKADKAGGMRSSNASCKSPPGGGTAKGPSGGQGQCHNPGQGGNAQNASNTGKPGSSSSSGGAPAGDAARAAPGSPRGGEGGGAQAAPDGDSGPETAQSAARNAFDNLFKTGRTFSEKDRRTLTSHALHSEDNGERAPRPDDRPGRPAPGRARPQLAGGHGPDRIVRSHEGEMKEDDLRQGLDAHRNDIAPEYRPALDNYYKSISRAAGGAAAK